MPGYQVTRRNSQARGRYAPYVRAAGRVAGRIIRSHIRKAPVRKSSGFAQTEATPSSNEATMGGGITTQNDVQVQYKRGKRKSYGKSKFAKRVEAVLKKEIAPRTIVFNDTISQSIAAAADTQAISACVVLGSYGGADNTSAEVGMRDMFTLCNNDPDNNEASESLMVTTSIIDITFCNTGAAPLEVDIYSMICVKNTNHQATPLTEVTTAENQTPTMGGATALTMAVRGTTPFDFPMFAKLGNRIISKTKHFVAANGGVFTTQWRNSKKRYVKTQTLIGQNGTDYCYENYTRYYLIVVKKVVGNAALAALWSIGTTRKYIYKPFAQQNKVWDGVL